jgi:hypothetical protein
MTILPVVPWLVAGIPVLLLAMRPGVAAATTLTRGPYLQLVTSDSATIVWRTDRATACSVAIRPLGGTTSIVSGGTGTDCAVTASGLVAGTEYAYQPRGDGAAVDGEAAFRTDDPDLPFTFLVFGDSGGGDREQYAVRDRMLEHPADLMVHTGDMVYDTGRAADFDPKFFKPYAPLLRHMVLWPCLGNHDVRTKNGQPWLDAFFTPANNAAGTERYYSFDYGNAHFVVLDTNSCTDPGCKQHTFLEDDLANTDAVWKFVFFHHSIYSAGDHGSATRIRADLVPIFDAYGVDVVFMGHDHHYERTFPMRDDTPVEPGEGTVYITTGGGGRTLRAVGSARFTAYAESAHHFMRVGIDRNVLNADMVRVDGVIRDSLAIVKPSDEPPHCGDDLVNQSTEQCDGVRDDACPGACRADCTCPPVCGDGRINHPQEECDPPADVTAAFRDGPGVYTLAIRNDVSDGVTYASREYSNQIRRPALTLTFSRP